MKVETIKKVRDPGRVKLYIKTYSETDRLTSSIDYPTTQASRSRGKTDNRASS